MTDLARREGDAPKFEASNPGHQALVNRLVAEGGYTPCSDCGAPILWPGDCSICLGGDDYGRPFCSAEDYCCGC
jgi:hypothetical protein